LQIVALARDVGPFGKAPYCQAALLELYGRLSAWDMATEAVPFFLEQAIAIATRNPAPAFTCIGLIAFWRPAVVKARIEPIFALIAAAMPIVPANRCVL
jgi:hypothetical protein